MNTQYAFWRSRTFWSIVAMFVVSGTNGIMGLIPDWSVIYVQTGISLLATYFHLETAKTFGARN